MTKHDVRCRSSFEALELRVASCILAVQAGVVRVAVQIGSGTGGSLGQALFPVVPRFDVVKHQQLDAKDMRAVAKLRCLQELMSDEASRTKPQKGCSRLQPLASLIV